MSGKLKGIPALNTNTLSNKFCISQSNKGVDNSICTYCYSVEMLETFRKNCVNRFEKNSVYLSSRVHEFDYLPKAVGVIARFNGHGELINKTHLENIFRICENQPNTIFALWTKKIGIVQSTIKNGRKKPINLILVYSNEYIDNIIEEPPKFFDKVFNNVSKDTDKINCRKDCIECMLCYSKNKTNIIIERVK